MKHDISHNLVLQRNRRLRKKEIDIPVTYARTLGYCVKFCHTTLEAEKAYRKATLENIPGMKTEDNQLNYETWLNPFLQFRYADNS